MRNLWYEVSNRSYTIAMVICAAAAVVFGIYSFRTDSNFAWACLASVGMSAQCIVIRWYERQTDRFVETLATYRLALKAAESREHMLADALRLKKGIIVKTGQSLNEIMADPKNYEDVSTDGESN